MTTRMNVRVLAVFGIVALPLLVVAAYLTMGAGRSELREAGGRRLAQMAELLSSSTDVFVHRRVIFSNVLARVPTVREAASDASQVPFNEPQTQSLDKAWQAGPDIPATVEGVLTNGAARFLSDVTRQDLIYREVLLTDRYGRLTAASGRTTDYFQADEDWWKEAYGDGVHGHVFVTGAVYDESAQSHAIQIAVPVMNAAETAVVGVLKVIADIRELSAIVTGARIGETGDARLVRPDGSLVLRSTSAGGAGETFFAAETLRRELATRDQGQGPLFQLSFAAPTNSGETRLVGVAPSQLGSSYPNVGWLVVVSQDEREIFGPVDAQTQWLLLMLAVAALTMSVLALIFSSWLAAPPVPEYSHLSTHPAVTRIDDATERPA